LGLVHQPGLAESPTSVSLYLFVEVTAWRVPKHDGELIAGNVIKAAPQKNSIRLER